MGARRRQRGAEGLVPLRLAAAPPPPRVHGRAVEQRLRPRRRERARRVVVGGAFAAVAAVVVGRGGADGELEPRRRRRAQRVDQIANRGGHDEEGAGAQQRRQLDVVQPKRPRRAAQLGEAHARRPRVLQLQTKSRRPRRRAGVVAVVGAVVDHVESAQRPVGRRPRSEQIAAAEPPAAHAEHARRRIPVARQLRRKHNGRLERRLAHRAQRVAVAVAAAEQVARRARWRAPQRSTSGASSISRLSAARAAASRSTERSSIGVVHAVASASVKRSLVGFGAASVGASQTKARSHTASSAPASERAPSPWKRCSVPGSVGAACSPQPAACGRRQRTVRGLPDARYIARRKPPA